ncbi:transposase (plasmid) [Legionella lytica]|uniref:Transposase n=1 Tax=Legionella lytica TaxID=96232 RepID=A0ABY4YDW6_9GAMM|nr:transposase [Legionella lytica]
MVHETYHSRATVSYVARKHGILPSQLFYWRKLMETSALTGVKADKSVVPQSGVNELKRRIKQLKQMLGKNR